MEARLYLVIEAYKGESKRFLNNLLIAELDLDRSTFWSHWKALADFLLPRRARFQVTDNNRGDRRNLNIVDNTGTIALRTLRSGMMSGVTSPARPWKRLTTQDPDMMESGPIKDWLYKEDRKMDTVFLKSNLYNVLPLLYGDMGCFGSSAMMVEEDFKTVVRFYSFPIGSYWIGSNAKNQINVFAREFRMTVRQLVEKFATFNAKGQLEDMSNFSEYVQNLWKRGNREVWVDVRHIIKPNDKYDKTKLGAEYKKFSSCYYEQGVSGEYPGGYLETGGYDDDRYLRESGYDIFPVLCPRWEVTGEDVYGTECPGMQALGDVKALQIMQERKAQAVEKMVNPPLEADTDLMGKSVSLLPGKLTWFSQATGKPGVRPIHEVQPHVQELMLDIQDHQRRINEAFFVNLFLMISQDDRMQRATATEINERHEEKLLALGPVLERLNQDLLDPLIDITFYHMQRQGLVSVPPPEMQGQPIKVEYISMMAQAQKLISLAGIERFASFAQNVIAAHPEAGDKVDTDQMLDEYADITSIAPGIVRPDDEVASIRMQRQKAMQAQQAAQNAPQIAGAVKDLSDSDTQGDNALTRLLQQANAGNAIPTQ